MGHLQFFAASQTVSDSVSCGFSTCLSSGAIKSQAFCSE